ncbi:MULTISPECIES: hypothetical protein [Anoxybacillaceae]|uniref:Uncharacterized protein n=1 Tax=Parageobacillus thermoglucosidasius TaxID=1426 RepID=A0AB38R008_PARTM|nr:MULTISPECIES: hypothetical protein [Bacillaceae]MEC5188792.1 hypothetical protein [Geobacillus thermodenitrificans]UOE76919.1 hypothetical protein IMI45_03375 [Parageobacillus thermoglucosidasius]GMO01652.1 hypothetical protein PthstB1num2_36930 [Parageobacillus thermoglucosidasius]
MNILKMIFGNSKEKQGCCDIQIVEVKESQDVADKATMESECCSSTSHRGCC